MTDAKKRPSFPWYPGDHRRDTNVQGCSYAARGLWNEMMNLMHDGEPYGHLTTGGKAMTDAKLASMTGGQLPEVRRLLRELGDAKIYSKTAAGVIYCRRMVKDEATRRQKKTNGKLGGNPKLLNHEDNQQDIQPLNQHVNGSDNQTPASAVAVASPSIQPPAVAAFIAALPASENPLRWTGIIGGWPQGMGLAGGVAATAEDIATGLSDYMATNDRDFSVIHVRSFVERAQRSRIKGVARDSERKNGVKHGAPKPTSNGIVSW